jgi:signal transduction histidine kinase
MRRPLRNQILYPFAGLVAAAILAVSAAGAWQAARTVDDQIDAHVRSAADVLLTADFPLTDAVLRQTRGLTGAELVCVEVDGELRAASMSDAQGFLESARAGEVGAARQAAVVDGGEYLQWTFARTSRGATVPVLLHVFYSQSQRRRLLSEAIWPPLWVGVAALAAASALSFWLAAKVGKPIAAVRGHFAQLAAGNYSPLDVPARDDEVRDLVVAANTLAKQLEQRDLAVRRSARSTLLGQLSGGLCHHLRNASAGAKLAVQLHRRRCAADDGESLTVALRQLDFAEQYVQRMLTLGKPAPLKMQSLDLRDVVQDALSLVEPTFRHRGVTLRRQLPEGSFQPLNADREQLRQLLVNLLLNAVDAAGDAGWVRIELLELEQSVRLSIADSGDGPPPEIRDRLFEPFVTGKPDGIGLGLAASRHIAELHGGAIRYDGSTGTRFDVILPRGPRPRQPHDREEAEA